MLSFFPILFALVMALSGIFSGSGTVGIIGGADGPVSVMLSTEADGSTRMIDNAAAHLQQLTGDAYALSQAKMLFTIDGVEELLERYDAVSGTAPIARYELSALRDSLKEVFPEFPAPQTEAGREALSQQLNSAATMASLFYSYEGNTAAAAISDVLSYRTICPAISESCLYLLEYENGVGIVVGIWNDGYGLCMVTASFVPNAGLPLQAMMEEINGDSGIQ